MPYRALADAILVVHFAFVSYVVVGLVFIWLGYFLGLRCVRNFTFRATHLLAMAVVVAEALCGVVCPLTRWESRLRELAGSHGYGDASFLQHWIHRVMFFDLAESTFTAIYVAVFVLIVASLVVSRPEPPAAWLRRRRSSRRRAWRASRGPVRSGGGRLLP